MLACSFFPVTPDYISQTTVTTAPDLIQPAQSASIYPAPTQTLLAQVRFTSNYTNPLCLPRPDRFYISGSVCAAQGVQYTFYVYMYDWNQQIVTTFTGG